MDENDSRISKKMLRQFEEEFPEGFDPERSYGIIPRQRRPEDTVCRIDYDHYKRHLKLNSFTIQTFQLESNADIYFTKLFQHKGWEKRITVHKPARAGVLVNNIKMPIKLRNAIFDTGRNDTLLIAHTVIRYERARHFNVREEEIKEYLDKCRDVHYSLVKAGKRK